jgi:hypothetical protein
MRFACSSRSRIDEDSYLQGARGSGPRAHASTSPLDGFGNVNGGMFSVAIQL